MSPRAPGAGGGGCLRVSQRSGFEGEGFPRLVTASGGEERGLPLL